MNFCEYLLIQSRSYSSKGLIPFIIIIIIIEQALKICRFKTKYTTNVSLTLVRPYRTVNICKIPVPNEMTETTHMHSHTRRRSGALTDNGLGVIVRRKQAFRVLFAFCRCHVNNVIDVLLHFYKIVTQIRAHCGWSGSHLMFTNVTDVNAKLYCAVHDRREFIQTDR